MAQNGPRERIKAFKVAYITEQLNLTSKEAQKFWPIYNEHQETIETLRIKERRAMASIKGPNQIDNISDQQAGDLLNNYVNNVEQKSKARQKLIKDLQNVLPKKKILKLVKAEIGFNKRMLDKIRERRRH